MEARLAKMRIVGLQYDSMEIHTENLELDFTLPEHHPGHAMYSLRNGGGKGVFLQTLIQTLEPGSPWKNEKNKVSHFFYNNEGKPVYYTVHIIQEWYLSDMKSVILGISIAPKFTSLGRDTDASSVGLDYFTYVKEVGPLEKVDIFKDYPFDNLWDEKEEESLSLDELKANLKDENDYMFFPMQDVEGYREKIEEYGVTEATISIIKQINTSEGDFGDFFKGATDNLGLFYKLLIPTINDKIEGIDSRNKGDVSSISVTFLDTLKISKELPDLLAMVDNIEQINDLILPLKENFEMGKVLEMSLEDCIGKGISLLELLEAVSAEKMKDLSEKEQEQAQRKKELYMTEWKFHNVDYISLRQKKDALDGEYFELEHKQKKEDLTLKSVKKDLTESKVRLELKRREDLVKSIDEKNHSIAALIESEDTSASNKKMEEIKQYFLANWNEISNQWKKEMNRNASSMKAHEEKLMSLQSELQTEREECSEITYQLRDVEKAIKHHEEKIREANSRYGDELTYLIYDILVSVEQEHEKESSALQDKLEKKVEKEQTILNLNVDIGKKEVEIETLKLDIAKTAENVRASKEKENMIVDGASSLLKEPITAELERHEYAELRTRLESHLQSYRDKYQIELRKKWNLDEDVFLIEEGESKGCYIPNKDLLKVKSLLDAQKINTMFGTEFLSKLTRDEAKFELERNPAIRYSIVVLEDKFEGLNLSFIEEELLRNHVVLIDRTQASKKTKHITTNPHLNKLDEVNYVLKDLSFLFIEDDVEYQQWKATLEKQADDIDFELETINNVIKKAEKVIGQIIRILDEPIKVELDNSYLQLVKGEKAVQDNLILLHKKLDDTLQDKQQLESDISHTEAAVRNLDEQMKELAALNKAIEEDKKNKKEKSRLEEQRSYKVNLINQLTQSYDHLTTQKINNELSYKAWFEYVNKHFRILKRMLKDVHMTVADEVASYTGDDLRPQSYPHSLSPEAYRKLVEYQEFEADVSSKNARIADIRAEAKVLNEKLVDIETELQTICGDNKWKEINVPAEDILHLANDVKKNEKNMVEVQKKLDKIHEDMSLNNKEMASVKSSIEDKELEMEKDFPEEGAQYIDKVDCKEAKEQYRYQRRLLKREIKEADVLIASLQRTMNEIENTARFIRSNNFHLSKKAVPLSEKEIIKGMNNPGEFYFEWNSIFTKFRKQSEECRDFIRGKVNKLKDKVEAFQHLPEHYKNELVYFLSAIRDIEYDEAINNLNNYLDWAKHNLQNELEQKEKADKAVGLWVDRSSRRVLQIVRELENLVSKMTIVNWTGERFPLIKYNKHFPFPTNLEDIKVLVHEFCMNEIDWYVKKGKKDVDDLTVWDVAKTVNVSNVVLKALGQYPRLLIHIPGIEGALLRGSAKHAKYKEWEVINNGSVDSATKSGGQTLMAQFIVIAMLMRQRVDENSSLFLVTDNPFGTMSANELVEATFSLLDLLNIQWLVVAPPITNVQITAKFHTVHNMSIQVKEGKKVLTKKLFKNYRKFLNNISVLDNNADKEA
ncbi:hypothetical protein FIU87_03405 [Bacillus sp. THAF10]|uniref:hypothetical protein n=1 Tax=Bacillus sp. THAF10 TaxID=2587848 RepID=UPI0012682225|nr:hypothetical protein [Bacillus sp. THAF10]QFT87689.1 hypothetical protein FIU87_03405 [Bacillus sp. THAF10]